MTECVTLINWFTVCFRHIYWLFAFQISLSLSLPTIFDNDELIWSNKLSHFSWAVIFIYVIRIFRSFEIGIVCDLINNFLYLKLKLFRSVLIGVWELLECIWCNICYFINLLNNCAKCGKYGRFGPFSFSLPYKYKACSSYEADMQSHQLHILQLQVPPKAVAGFLAYRNRIFVDRISCRSLSQAK